MKHVAWVTLAVGLLLIGPALPVAAGGGYHGGGAVRAGGGYHRGYHGVHHRGYYGGTRVFIGGWWGPSYTYPYPCPYPYPYYATPPVVIQQQPQEYIQQGAAPPQQNYWYYCQNPQGYYPYIKECPTGWLQVVPQPAPPSP
jgi:hypothetical protein